MIVVVPIRTGRGLNERLHWAERARRVKRERAAVALCIRTTARKLNVNFDDFAGLELVVTLVRVGPHELDSDNCIAGLKAVRDEVAHALGVDDGDPLITWVYDQRKGGPGEYAVEIGINTREAR